MEAIDETSGQSRSAPPRGPVFVDESGRRLLLVKLVGLGALGLVAGYVVLLLVAFMGGSNVAAPYLPLPAAPAARDVPSSPPPPQASDEATPPAQQGEPAEPAPAAFQAPVAGPSTVPVAPSVNDTTVDRAAPSAPVTPQEAITEATSPGKSGTAPGQTTRPSAPPQP